MSGVPSLTDYMNEHTNRGRTRALQTAATGALTAAAGGMGLYYAMPELLRAAPSLSALMRSEAVLGAVVSAFGIGTGAATTLAGHHLATRFDCLVGAPVSAVSRTFRELAASDRNLGVMSAITFGATALMAPRFGPLIALTGAALGAWSFARHKANRALA